MNKIIWFILCLSMLKAEDVYATFNVIPYKKAMLALSSSGVVEKINVEVGQEVKKDEVLLNLKDEDQQQVVASAQANYESMKYQFDFSKTQNERYQKSKNVLDQNTVEQINMQFLAKEQELEGAKRNLMLQEELLKKLYLKAPFDGIITEKLVESGDGVGAVQTQLFQLITKETKLLLEFDSKYLSKIKNGQSFFYNIDGAASGKSAKIVKIYPSVNSQTRKVTAEAVTKDNLVSGIFGDGIIKAE